MATCSAADFLSAGLVRVDAGHFTMGRPANEAGRDDGEVGHEVTLTMASSLRPTEVRQGWYTHARWSPTRGVSGSDRMGALTNAGERVGWVRGQPAHVHRVARGGSEQWHGRHACSQWRFPAKPFTVRAAFRLASTFDIEYANHGFRLVRIQ